MVEHPAPLPEDPLQRKQLDACFERCWSRFEEASPAHAAVMAWIVEDGLTNEEISELLGRTPGATREFVSQCRKRAAAPGRVVRDGLRPGGSR